MKVGRKNNSCQSKSNTRYGTFRQDSSILNKHENVLSYNNRSVTSQSPNRTIVSELGNQKTKTVTSLNQDLSCMISSKAPYESKNNENIKIEECFSAKKNSLRLLSNCSQSDLGAMFSSSNRLGSEANFNDRVKNQKSPQKIDSTRQKNRPATSNINSIPYSSRPHIKSAFQKFKRKMTAHPKTSKLPLPISSPPASIRPAPPSNPNFLSSNAMAPSSLKRTLSVCLPKPVVLHSASSQLNRSCIFQNRESASRKLFSNQAIVHILTPNSPQPQKRKNPAKAKNRKKNNGKVVPRTTKVFSSPVTKNINCEKNVVKTKIAVQQKVIDPLIDCDIDDSDTFRDASMISVKEYKKYSTQCFVRPIKVDEQNNKKMIKILMKF